jgi:hypothetical protein
MTGKGKFTYIIADKGHLANIVPCGAIRVSALGFKGSGPTVDAIFSFG